MYQYILDILASISRIYWYMYTGIYTGIYFFWHYLSAVGGAVAS